MSISGAIGLNPFLNLQCKCNSNGMQASSGFCKVEHNLINLGRRIKMRALYVHSITEEWKSLAQQAERRKLCFQ